VEKKRKTRNQRNEMRDGISPQRVNLKTQAWNEIWKLSKFNFYIHVHHEAPLACWNSQTASFVGSAGIAPLFVTAIAPQTFAKYRASLNLFSSCQEPEQGN